MNCCNSYGECEHGHGCPLGAVTVPPTPSSIAARTCESLGVCQHPESECTGACRQVPRIHAWEPVEPGAPVQGFEVEQLGRDNIVTAVLVAALAGVTLGILYGAGRWVYQAYGVLS